MLKWLAKIAGGRKAFADSRKLMLRFNASDDSTARGQIFIGENGVGLVGERL